MTNKNITKTPIADWLIEPENWNKKNYVEETINYMMENVSNCNPIDQHLIGMLADTMEILIKCSHNMKLKGLVVYNKSGEIIGKSPYVSIYQKQHSLALLIMKQLNLMPVIKN